MKIIAYLFLFVSQFVLTGCLPKQKTVNFEDDENDVSFEVVETEVFENIDISGEKTLGQEFEIEYRTYEPGGLGKATFKASSIKEIKSAGDRVPTEGNKLILVEISVKGNAKNRGKPSTFNQIGNYPSPQFVVIDKEKNTSLVENTYYSDGYTENKKLFELSKITLDHETWVNTAIVFEIGNDKVADLAFRFTNSEGKTEFYDIKEN